MTNPPERVATRLYIEGALVEGGAVLLATPQTHRLRHVLRLRLGAAVAGFNARDGEFLCRVAELDRRGLLHVEARLREPPPESDAGPWLVFAPIKRQRLELVIEKGTELGVGAFIPVVTARTQPERPQRDRLIAHAIAAAEQSERLTIPEIRQIAPLASVLAAWPGERRLLVCDETGGGAPIADALTGLTPRAPVALLTGPEGGFAPAELDALAGLPFVTRVSLGPLVLRAETAALAALAVYQAIAGDWRRARTR